MRLTAVLMAVLCSFAAVAQTNLDFEKAGEGNSAEGWRAAAGTYSWIGDGCEKGKCVRVTPQQGGAFGVTDQSFDATPWRGKLVRFRASVKVEAGGRAQLTMRVERRGGQPGFAANMIANPIVDWDWTTREIDGLIHEDAERIILGLMVQGKPAWFDEATLTVTGDLPQMKPEPARTLTSRGAANLIAFAKLAGIVRHFHPSDEAARADWNRLVIDGVRMVEPAETADELASALRTVFEPVAPTLRVYAGSTAPKPHPALTPSDGLEVLRWRHKGYGAESPAGNIYSSDRVRSNVKDWNPERDLYTLDCGDGVTALVPLGVFADRNRSLPAADAAAPAAIPPAAWSGNDRGTRLAAVILAWNILQHFYPYFDVVKTDWAGALPKYLQRAASDADDIAFARTLKLMIAELKDGHGSMMYRFTRYPGRAPLRVEWIENKVVITGVGPELGLELKAGDEIVRIGERPVVDAITEAEQSISAATPRWRRFVATRDLLNGPQGESVMLTVLPPGAKLTRSVKVTFQAAMRPIPSDPRPEKSIAELAPGIWYVDVTRATDELLETSIPKLKEAKGIVFDIRGYPRVRPDWLTHLTGKPLKSAQWHVPLVRYPGKMEFERSGEWDLPPKEPYFGAKKVFLTNGSAISYAESTMGIVEYYRMGAIVGEATAGTNGNVISIQLPGGYTAMFTGMKVLKHDGTQHHMVGIQATIPCTRTQAGVAAGRDELLERALKALAEPGE